MNKNYIGTYGVIKKNGGIDLIYSETEGEGNIFFSILKCIEENDDYLKVIVIGKGKEHLPKIAIIKREGYEILKKPKFDVGDKVRLIIWHKKDRRIYYILDVEGNKKRSNSWYYEDENKFEKIGE